MLKNYKIYHPSLAGSLVQEWELCRELLIADFCFGKRLIKLNIFVNACNFDEYQTIQKYISDSLFSVFFENCPAFSVTSHPPLEPYSVVVEAAYSVEKNIQIEYKKNGKIAYVLLKTRYGKELWVGGLGSGIYSRQTDKVARLAFNQMQELLVNEGFSMNDIVRQWNYIGNILSVENGFQNYQIFNEIRNEFYTRYRTSSSYPAATGIGMKHGGVIIDFCAIQADDSLRIKAVDNPNQVNPYIYGQQVLKGLAPEGKCIKQAPQFERAKLIANCQVASLYISGTASIIGQETIGKGDVVRQTIVTIDNINQLTSKDNITRLADLCDNYPNKCTLLRIYVKRQDDFEAVKSVCDQYFTRVPSIYIEADICRDDLLVEIEAEMISDNLKI